MASFEGRAEGWRDPSSDGQNEPGPTAPECPPKGLNLATNGNEPPDEIKPSADGVYMSTTGLGGRMIDLPIEEELKDSYLTTR